MKTLAIQKVTLRQEVVALPEKVGTVAQAPAHEALDGGYGPLLVLTLFAACLMTFLVVAS